MPFLAPDEAPTLTWQAIVQHDGFAPSAIPIV
jgi:hypothetical protein